MCVKNCSEQKASIGKAIKQRRIQHVMEIKDITGQVPVKQTLRQRFACRKLTGESSKWEHRLEREMEAGLSKLTCKVIAAEALADLMGV